MKDETHSDDDSTFSNFIRADSTGTEVQVNALLIYLSYFQRCTEIPLINYEVEIDLH